jgi:nitrite reductase/ring-hydroxylating ferredoxin subunit
MPTLIGITISFATRAGRIYALFGLCPHQNNPLDGATLWDNLIDCPFHHFQYDVTTARTPSPGTFILKITSGWNYGRSRPTGST